MKEITIQLTDGEHARLQRLADERTKQDAHSRNPRTFTPEMCLVDFVRACQPGGSGWKYRGPS